MRSVTIRDMADAVKQSVTARQVAESLGLKVNAAGMCKCPIHGEKTGSMKVYPGTRGWYCFGCHQGGSVIDLVMLYYGLDVKGAVELLNNDFNLGLPIGREETEEQRKEAERRRAEREAEMKRREAMTEAQREAFDRYCDIGYRLGQYELDKAQYAPKTGDDEMDPRYVEAMMQIPILKDEAERLSLVCFGKDE